MRSAMRTQKTAALLSRKRVQKRSAQRALPAIERLEERLTPASITLQTTVRDFQPSHPDFQHDGGSIGVTTGLVQLDNGNLKFVGADGAGSISNASNFAQWYHDVPGVNRTTTLPLTLNETSTGLYQFKSSAFFPIDKKLFGNSVVDGV